MNFGAAPHERRVGFWTHEGAGHVRRPLRRVEHTTFLRHNSCLLVIEVTCQINIERGAW